MPLPADLPSWVYGYAALFGLVHAVVLYYLYRATRTGSIEGRPRPADDDSLAAADDRTVVCDNCGAENELGYRYCRNCVAELSGVDYYAGTGATPRTRGIL